MGAGTASARFRITARRPPPPPVIPAKVVVVKRGFAGEERSEKPGSWSVGYGLVLQNLSPDQDALDVNVITNVLDASGRILDTDDVTYEAIPAGTTYYGGDDVTYQGGAPARLAVIVRIGSRQPKVGIVLPPVSNVRVTEDPVDEVVGEVANPSSSKLLSDLARITITCFDAAGTVIGGGFNYVPATLPPRARVGWGAWIYGLSASQIASVRVSVEPEYK